MPSKAENRNLWAIMLRPLVAAMGIMTCAVCCLAAWQWTAPLSAPTLFPFSQTWYAKAAVAATPDAGVADAQMAAKLSPASAENWMVLAYQLSRADHGISPRVVAAIRQSYQASQLAPLASAYRLSFIFNAWSSLPSDIHELARHEAQAYGTSVEGLTFLVQTAPAISDPRARLEFGMLALAAKSQFYMPIKKQ